MQQGSGAPGLDRASVQPVQFSAQERVLLAQQSKYDRRHITLTWLWRLLREEDGPGGTAQDEDFGEAPRVHRRYAAPIAVHLFLDDTQKRKWTPKGMVETTDGTAKIGWSRAEARRIGQHLSTHDVREGLTTDALFGDPIYVPRSEDVVLWRGAFYYEIGLLKPEYMDMTSPIVAVWKGTASLFRDDSTAPLAARLPQPPTPLPVPEVTDTWRK
jgi:hypothetical protein